MLQHWRCLPLALLLHNALTGAAEPVTRGALTLEPSLNLRLGLQQGTGINFGAGALDDPGQRNRSSVSASAEPRLGARWQLADSEFYGGVSVAGAATALDGEISGAFARAGDATVDTDEAFVGWRNARLDLSFGGQEFSVGDGLVIADGNFDTGGEDGNYWVVPFNAWRNSAILKLTGDTLRADMFWLRSDRDFGDARVAGVNVETIAQAARGRFGAMYLEILEGDRLALDGLRVWDFRAGDVPVPGIANLRMFGEVVRQVGRDADAARDNDALGWYLEGQYHFPAWRWTPTLTFRYARFSGDDAGTPDNEGYRTLFYTFYKREWDTWYMGEIASEYHLFNANQVTRMTKFEFVPRANWVVSLYYYRHDLDAPNYFGLPVSSTAWADEINLAVEYFRGLVFYAYAGIAWSTPDSAAREVFGADDDFTVLQTWLSYSF